MKDFDWELLHELYKNPNLTKVANVLYITQPTLTKRLQHIEAEFDVTIVERTPKGLEFTPEGKYLAEQAEVYLRFLKQTRSHLEQMRENGGEIVTVGSSYTYGKYTLPDQLIRFRMECPNVRFQVQNAHSNQLFRQLLDGTPVTRNTWFLYPKNKRLNENVEHFVDFILRQRRTIASATGSGSFSPAVCQNTSEASTR